MKKILLLFFAIALLSSCSSVFIPCHTDMPPESFKTTTMPISTGNSWNYTYTKINREGEVTKTVKTVREIGGLDTLFYKDANLDKRNVTVYKIKIDNKIAKNFYYMKCEEGVTLIRCYEYAPDEIGYGRTIPDNPADKWEDPRYADSKWAGPEKVTTPAGEFDCWVCTFEDPFVKKKFIREYYAEGVGLVKTEWMNWKYRVLEKIELTDYTIQ